MTFTEFAVKLRVRGDLYDRWVSELTFDRLGWVDMGEEAGLWDWDGKDVYVASKVAD